MANQNNKKISGGMVLIIIFLIIWIVGACSGGSGKSSSKYNGTTDTVRCSYCGKVIRSNGRNIHATTVLNGNTLKCDYCGHKTNY